MYDIIIAGAGTAGLSAAIYGARAGKKILILESKTYGGQIINTPEVENYPGIKHISGFEFATNLYEQAIGLGAEVKLEKVLKVEESGQVKSVVTTENVYEGKTVIIATGAKNRPLGVDREEEMIGKGVSYCATCDGAFFRGKDVAIVGGGNTALEDASFLSAYCKNVYVIHRRDSFRGEDKLLEVLKNKENVSFILNSNVVELIGEQTITHVMIENKETNEKTQLEVQGVFVAIGQMPDNQDFSNVIKLDEKGYVVAGEDSKTGSDGIFTAGDCRTKEVRQLTTAAADGAVAALAACSYIDGKNL